MSIDVLILEFDGVEFTFRFPCIIASGQLQKRPFLES